MSKSNIIIIEDNVELRNNIQAMLITHGYSVVGVGSADEFYRIISDKKFDLAIVDLGLPDSDDFGIIEYLNKHLIECRVIILSARETVEDRVNGYNFGADLYMMKPVESRELLAAIESLCKKQQVGKDIGCHGSIWLVNRSNRNLTAPNNCSIFLTSREWEFLSALLNKDDAIISREELLAIMDYGSASPENNNSLDAIVGRIRKKTKTKCNIELPIETIRSHGYTFNGEFKFI